VVYHCYRISQPILIGELLEYFNPDNSQNSNIKYAYICAFGLVISLFITTIIQFLTEQEIMNEAIKTRIACCSLIYRKVNLYELLFKENIILVLTSNSMDNFLKNIFTVSIVNREY